MKPERDMRFDVIRNEYKVTEGSYALNGERCPNCGQRSIVIGDDKTRRYCSNKMCNALILE
jgi:ribosomal protein S27AE